MAGRVNLDEDSTFFNEEEEETMNGRMLTNKKVLTNCPNCGAPLTSDGYCKYCETKVRYANEVEFNTLLHSGCIADILPTEILFKFKAEDGSLVVIPFVGMPENIEITYDEISMVGRHGETIGKIHAGSPIVRFDMAGHIAQSL